MATVTQQLADLETRVQQLSDGQAAITAALAKIGPADDAASLDAIRALAQSIADAIGVGPSQDNGNTTVPPAPVTPPTPGAVVVPPAPSETSGSAYFPNLNPTPASPI